MKDAVASRRELAVEIVRIVWRGCSGLLWLRAVECDDVGNSVPRLVKLDGCLHMGRDVALVLIEGFAEALAVHELVIEFSGEKVLGDRSAQCRHMRAWREGTGCRVGWT